MEKCIIVPWDFTEMSGYALEHAYAIGKISKKVIYLIHVAAKASKVPELTQQLEEIAKKFKEGKDIDIRVAVVTGNLYKAIYKFGLENNAYLGVMGTHGIKSLGKAMKVVKKFVKNIRKIYLIFKMNMSLIQVSRYFLSIAQISRLGIVNMQKIIFSSLYLIV